MIEQIRNFIKNEASVDELKILCEMHSKIKEKLEEKLEIKKRECAFEKGKAYRIEYKSMKNLVKIIKVMDFFDDDIDVISVLELRATTNGYGYHLSETTIDIADILFDDVIITPIDYDVYNELERYSNKFTKEYKDNCIEMYNKIKSI